MVLQTIRVFEIYLAKSFLYIDCDIFYVINVKNSRHIILCIILDINCSSNRSSNIIRVVNNTVSIALY